MLELGVADGDTSACISTTLKWMLPVDAPAGMTAVAAAIGRPISDTMASRFMNFRTYYLLCCERCAPPLWPCQPHLPTTFRQSPFLMKIRREVDVSKEIWHAQNCR